MSLPEDKFSKRPKSKQTTPNPDQTQIGVDAAGDPVFAKKAKDIEGSRSGRSNKSPNRRPRR
jgi:hypothetical protein